MKNTKIRFNLTYDILKLMLKHINPLKVAIIIGIYVIHLLII